jgi:replication factor A1
VVLLRGAKVGDFGGGRTLSVTQNTVFQINPDIPESHTLKGWFDQGGSNSDCTDLSHQGAGAMGGTSMGATSYKTLDQTKDEHLGMGDKADYFVTKAIILYAKKDNSMYMACPGDGCNKKVVDQNDGTYRCEKCAKNYSNFKWRMILSVIEINIHLK